MSDMETSTAVELSPDLTAYEAVQIVVELSEKRQVPPSKVADAVAVEVNGGSAGHELILRGLVSWANDVIHHGRSGRVDHCIESERSSGASASGRQPQPGVGHLSTHWQALRRIRLETADGERLLPLQDLAVSDLDANAEKYAAQARGAIKKRDFLERAAKSVRSAGAERIADLSDTTREKLEKAAQEAWE